VEHGFRNLPELLSLEPRFFGDSRGSFFEGLNQQTFQHAADFDMNFEQVNHCQCSLSLLQNSCNPHES
jgi:dTDP-4-dehydrorhamnose 3,5-epimerase-like enzyme